jgi:hypothetical protein
MKRRNLGRLHHPYRIEPGGHTTKERNQMTVAVRTASRQKFNSRKYGRWLTRTQPVVIKTAAEYNRLDAEIGRWLKKGHARLSPKNTPYKHC